MRYLNDSFKYWVLSLMLVTGFLLSSPQSAQAADLNFGTIGTVDVLGTGTVGNTLTVYEGYWSPAPTSYTYQWKRNGSDIPGATSSRYVVVGDDYLSNITVAVTASKSGYVTTTSVASSLYGATIYGRGTLSNSPSPTVSGTAQVGEYVFANTSGWDSGVSFTYQWYSNGYIIYGATGPSFQVQASQKNQRLSVTVVGSKTGYYSVTMSSASTEYVTPAVPKISWASSYGQLTGKNNLQAKAELAYGSTAQIRTWCLSRDSGSLDLPAGAKGVYFVDSGGTSITPVSVGQGCYTTSYGNIQNLRLRVDVTDWGIGAQNVYAIAKDAEGMVSAKTALSLYVAKTAPTLTGTFTSIPAVVVDNFQFSASTTTHSATAPVTELCMTVDMQPVLDSAALLFKKTSGSEQSATLVKSGGFEGCIYASGGGDLAQGSITLDSKMFANGNHELVIRVRSWDGETAWWSDPIKTTFRTKNAYIPTVTWNPSNSFVPTQGAANRIGGLISANIPGTPGRITLSLVTADGVQTPFFESSNQNTFAAAPLLKKNSTVQLEVFDEDAKSVYTSTTKLSVAPLVKLAKPKVSLTISTLSTAVTKTVTLGVTSAKGQAASCKASWSGGSKPFKISDGKGSVVFVPRGSGTVSVVCSATEMATSKPVTMRY